MNESHGIDKSNVEAINRWLDDHPGITGREAARQLGIHESYIRRAKAARPKGQIMLLRIADIVRTSATQPRLAICPETVERYRVAKLDGAKFRPPVVFDDGQVKRLGDGFHRTEADILLGVESIECEVREGGEREAYLYAITANKSNGLPLSTPDIKACVLRLAIDEPKLSKRELGRLVGIDEKQVRRWLEPKPNATTAEAIEAGRRGETTTDPDPAPPDTGQFIEDIDLGPDPGPMPPGVLDGPWSDPDPAPPDAGQFIEDREEEIEKHPDAISLDELFADPDPAPPLPSLAVKHELPPMTGELPEPVAKLTDAEWLAGLAVRNKLSDTCRAVFDRDALLYRELVTDDEDYQRWSRKAKKALDSKTPGLRGWYHAELQRPLRLKHPASALVCGECSGKGCETCRRRGYQLG